MINECQLLNDNLALMCLSMIERNLMHEYQSSTINFYEIYFIQRCVTNELINCIHTMCWGGIVMIDTFQQ